MRVAVETKDDRILSINTLTNAISLEDDKDGYWEISLDYAIEHFFEEFQELMQKMNIQLNFVDAVKQEEKKKISDNEMICTYVKDIKAYTFDYVKDLSYWNSEDDPTHEIMSYCDKLIEHLASK